MSEHLTPAQTSFVWDQFRAGGHNGLSDAQVEALFDTIDRLRTERRVTKGLHAKIDKQAATIQRVRDVAKRFEANYDLASAHYDLEEALDGGQEVPEQCGNCGGRGEEFINVDRDVGTCHSCDGTGFDGAKND